MPRYPLGICSKEVKCAHRYSVKATCGVLPYTLEGCLGDMLSHLGFDVDYKVEEIGVYLKAFAKFDLYALA
jgi:hypothetical protein